MGRVALRSRPGYPGVCLTNPELRNPNYFFTQMLA